MDTHPLDHPLMREAHRLRDLADTIDSLRRELAPRDKIAATDRKGALLTIVEFLNTKSGPLSAEEHAAALVTLLVERGHIE